MNYEIVRLQDRPKMIRQTAGWFHEKWQIPLAAYLDSMEECLANADAKIPIPSWYMAIKEGKIIGGLGVIDNDFHNRKDLTPNVCAVYVEKEARGQGIAGALLAYVCTDMKEQGIDTLYLVTDHTSFYERYGWHFLCMVQKEGTSAETRLYIHKQ